MRCEAVPVILDGLTGCPVLYAGSIWKFPSPVSLAVPKKSSVHIYGVDQMPLARMDGRTDRAATTTASSVRWTLTHHLGPTDRPARGGRERVNVAAGETPARMKRTFYLCV